MRVVRKAFLHAAAAERMRGAGRVVREVTDEQVATSKPISSQNTKKKSRLSESTSPSIAKREQADVREEDVVAPVPVHVPDREQVHEEGDDADDREHRRAEGVVEDAGDEVRLASVPSAR